MFSLDPHVIISSIVTPLLAYAMGWDGFGPARFDLRSARRRLYDYERPIGEVLNGFYER